MRAPKQGQLVRVYWVDATNDPDWFTRNEVKFPSRRMETVGHYWTQNKDSMMLFSTLCEDWKKKKGTVGDMSTIPLGMITKIEKL